jgi:hypothetical protein
MDRLHRSKPYRVIMGKLKGMSGPADPLVEQSYRYPAAAWSEAEALLHCREHGGELFELANRPGRRG